MMPDTRIRLCSIAAAAGLISVAAPVTAKPVKHPEPAPIHVEKPRPPIVLASADATPVAKRVQPAETPQAVTPRVTTCRCGDPDSADAAPDGQ